MGAAIKVIVAGVEENYSRAHFTTWPLVKVDPNQDDFTGTKGHGSVVRKPTRQERKQLRTVAGLPRAK